ncbi:M23 family metallopeptidase [Streptomyces sp. DSM 116496]|uniref:M23 family metallopeptidase n=1 Tax=Streptomyces stoeckheimensis TaxID=3344656 RepID=UPI0038B26FC9
MTKLLLTLLLPLSLTLGLASAPPPAAPMPPRAPAGGRPLPSPLTVVRWWDPPPTPYAAGHRGVDLAAPVGAELRAVGPGRVHYAGQVAGRGVLSLTLPNGLRTTYEPVRPLVAEGAEVTAGQVVAVLTDGHHCSRPCLHWGLLHTTTYLNPLTLLPRPTPRLLPLLSHAPPEDRAQPIQPSGARGPGPASQPSGARGPIPASQPSGV